MKKKQANQGPKVPVYPAGTRDEIDQSPVLIQRDPSKPLSADNVVPVIAECARMQGDLTLKAFVGLCCEIADHHRQSGSIADPTAPASPTPDASGGQGESES